MDTPIQDNGLQQISDIVPLIYSFFVECDKMLNLELKKNILKNDILKYKVLPIIKTKNKVLLGGLS